MAGWVESVWDRSHVVKTVHTQIWSRSEREQAKVPEQASVS
jgi:hypothetical protein